MRNNFECKNSVVGGFDPNDVEILSFKIDRDDHLRKVLNIHVHDHDRAHVRAHDHAHALMHVLA